MDAVLKLRENEQKKIEGFLKLVEQTEAEGDDEIVPEIPRTPAEAARKERGSIADRRAAEAPSVEPSSLEEPVEVTVRTKPPKKDPEPPQEVAPKGKPQNVKKRPRKAAKKRGAKKKAKR
jgi:hypothetical protein